MVKLWCDGFNRVMGEVIKKEPVMIFAPADTNPYVPAGNKFYPTTCKHCKIYTDLCSIIRNTLETCCNLSTATNLQPILTAEKLPTGRLAGITADKCDLRNS